MKPSEIYQIIKNNYRDDQKIEEVLDRLADIHRMAKANKLAYQTVKSQAHFMCVNTSNWKDPQ